MQKETYIRATENEIIELIQTHLPVLKGFDSIVAAEELGNQDWTVSVQPADTEDFNILHHLRTAFSTRDILCILCSMGILEEAEYIIDCTW